MEDLSLILWRERELLETLLYKLEQEQLVLASGRTRWLARAAREVETVLRRSARPRCCGRSRPTRPLARWG